MPAVQNYAEILALLDTLRWPVQHCGRNIARGSKCFTLGCTLNARGSKNFEEVLPSGKGVNRRTVPSTVDAALGQRLWELMLEGLRVFVRAGEFELSGQTSPR